MASVGMNVYINTDNIVEYLKMTINTLKCTETTNSVFLTFIYLIYNF